MAKPRADHDVLAALLAGRPKRADRYGIAHPFGQTVGAVVDAGHGGQPKPDDRGCQNNPIDGDRTRFRF
mgnify:CR=1 FL=1